MKRIYISADIEGVAGVASWHETLLGNFEHAEASSQMTKEVVAACHGALAAGADEICVRDAHDSARNINISELPRGVKIIRGWGNSTDAMMEEIDKGFDGAICIGYHSEAGTDLNPLSHTIDHNRIAEVRLNGNIVSELELNSLIAAQYNVPILFVSGDEGICTKAEKILPGIVTVPVKRGSGDSIISLHPADACQEIEEAVKKAVNEMKCFCPKLQETYDLTVRYFEHQHAKKASLYPGARRVDAYTAGFCSADIKAVLLARIFMI